MNFTSFSRTKETFLLPFRFTSLTEWEDFIELDRDEPVNDKDKLKVVVTPQVVTPATSSKSFDECFMECSEQVIATPSSKSPEDLTVGSSRSTLSGNPQQSYLQRLLNEDDSGSEADAPCAKRGLKEHTYLMNLVKVKTR